MTKKSTPTSIPGAIIAGGTSRRMQTVASLGGDSQFHKGNLLLEGKSILARVIEQVQPQTNALVINTNMHNAFSQFGLAIIVDQKFSGDGPLAGLLNVMTWAKNAPGNYDWIASFPVDTPFLPTDLVAQLLKKAEETESEIVYAQHKNQTSQLVALWSLSLLEDLERWLESGERAVKKFIEQRKTDSVTFDQYPYDPFFNINTPEQLAQAEEIYQEYFSKNN